MERRLDTNYAGGRGALLRPPHRRSRMDAGQQRGQGAGCPLPASMRRHRCPARPGGAVAVLRAGGSTGSVIATLRRRRKFCPAGEGVSRKRCATRWRATSFASGSTPAWAESAALGLGWAQVDMGRDDADGRGGRERHAPGGATGATAGGDPREAHVRTGALFPSTRGRVCFPSEAGPSGRLHRLQHLNGRIGEAGGAAVLVRRAAQELHCRGGGRA